MGRGRTTTGMILALLLNIHHSAAGADIAALLQTLPSESSSRGSSPSLDSDDALLQGNYKIVQALIRVLPDGPAVKVCAPGRHSVSSLPVAG
jgi:hypothetical protein